MELDDDVCHCYHVSLRKLIHFARRCRPRVASQMAECLGAGTGCGFCIPLLEQIAAAQGDLERIVLPDETHAECTARRENYRRAKSRLGE